MIGFLIHDENLIPAARAIAACRELRTYTYQSTQRIGPVSVHFFRNAAPNNYFFSDDRHTLCVAGTLIFKDVHGRGALAAISAELQKGRELSALSLQFHGPYTLVCIDRVAEQVSLLNSREGLRHCFQTISGDLRAYSTNLLLLAALSEADLSHDSVRQFIHLGTIFDGSTIFKNVQHVAAGTLHTFAGRSWKSIRFWRLQPAAPNRALSRAQAVSTVAESFIKDFEFTSRIQSTRIAADLTGGTDSRLVLCCLLQKHARPVTTTSGPEDLVDVRIAKRVAERLGIEHWWYIPESELITHEQIAQATEIADGTRDVITVARLLPYYEEKARRFDMITGGGGGPLFKDHYWLYEFNRVGAMREPNWTRIAKMSLVAHAIQEDFFTDAARPITDYMAELFRLRSAEIEGMNNQKLDFVYFDLKVPAFGGQDFSFSTQFLDIFHPMLDADNVQYSINLPPAIRIRNILQFSIIERLRPDLRWLLTDTGLPAIAPVGVNSWLRILRGRRYLETAVRKLRMALVGASGERPAQDREMERLRNLGYFDLLDHSSLPAADIISVQRLAEFKESPGRQPHPSYLLNTLSVRLFVDRVKQLSAATKKVEPISPVNGR